MSWSPGHSNTHSNRGTGEVHEVVSGIWCLSGFVLPLPQDGWAPVVSSRDYVAVNWWRETGQYHTETAPPEKSHTGICPAFKCWFGLFSENNAARASTLDSTSVLKITMRLQISSTAWRQWPSNTSCQHCHSTTNCVQEQLPGNARTGMKKQIKLRRCAPKGSGTKLYVEHCHVFSLSHTMKCQPSSQHNFFSLVSILNVSGAAPYQRQKSIEFIHITQLLSGMNRKRRKIAKLPSTQILLSPDC